MTAQLTMKANKTFHMAIEFAKGKYQTGDLEAKKTSLFSPINFLPKKKRLETTISNQGSANYIRISKHSRYKLGNNMRNLLEKQMRNIFPR